MISNLLKGVKLYLQAVTSARKAVGLSSAGHMFNEFGRQLGWKLIFRWVRGGYTYLINPVSSFRYFEFPFVLSALPSSPGRCLDVSSPRLFSFYVSQKCRPISIWMINPDQNDIRLSANMAERLKISIIRAERQGVDVLDGLQEKFDSIWAISVIEHISGKHDDRLAVRLMYDALAAGGHLILTIPVDRQFWEEHRDLTYYGIGGMMPDKGKYFFQRYYDKSAIWKRLVESIDVEPFAVGWFGEKRMGHFLDYEKRWLRDGLSCTFNDPLEMSEHYQEYPSWDVMPGKGICGLAFKKPG